MGGVGIQQFFILIFFVFAFKFHSTIRSQSRRPSSSSSPKPKVLPLLYTLYAVLLLISIRIVFRLIEYSQGISSTIPNHEVYQYCLDTLPMFAALVLLNVVHPGRIMKGKEGDLPGRKERKLAGGRRKGKENGLEEVGVVSE
jgi:hypothetical protein